MTMGKVHSFTIMRSARLSMRMNMEITMPTISTRIRKEVPQRGCRRLCLRTFSTVSGSSAS